MAATTHTSDMATTTTTRAAPTSARKRDRSIAGFCLTLAGVGILMGSITAEALFTGAYSTHADTLSRLGGWEELAAGVEQERLTHPNAFLLEQGHTLAGPVSYYLADHATVFLEGSVRPSYYTAAEVAALKGRDAIFIARSVVDIGASLDAAATNLVPYFSRVRFLRRVVLHWGGRSADAYTLYLAEGYRGGLLVMGDGVRGACDSPPPEKDAPPGPQSWFCGH